MGDRSVLSMPQMWCRWSVWMINETYFSVMFHKTRLPEFPAALLFSLLFSCSRSLCRVKKISASDNDGKLDWFSVPVPPSSGTWLQVSGLSPSTDYQFSILSQNKLGTGPFSEIVATQTLGQFHHPVSSKSILFWHTLNSECFYILT